MKTNYLSLNFNRFVIFSVVMLLFFGFATNAFASRIYIETTAKEIATTQVFEANVYIDTENKGVNAFEGTIKFSEDMLDFQNVYFGNSVITVWLEKPHLLGGGSIYLSGITPGGYTGDKGLIATVIFKTKKSGSTSINPKISVLLNDGSGTSDVVQNKVFPLFVSSKIMSESFALEDTIPPERFTILIGNDTEIFNGQWFLVFDTQDKQSKIARFDVRESILPWFGGWHEGQSPYLLNNQKLEKFVSVRAVDEFGNERVITISPTNQFPLYFKFSIWFILIVFFVSLLYRYTKVAWRR